MAETAFLACVRHACIVVSDNCRTLLPLLAWSSHATRGKSVALADMNGWGARRVHVEGRASQGLSEEGMGHLTVAVLTMLLLIQWIAKVAALAVLAIHVAIRKFISVWAIGAFLT